MLSKIYTFAGCPVLGSVGNDSIIRYGSYCEVCKREAPRVIEFLDYCFDGWEGEDIVKADECYAVTTRLRDALEQSGLTGFSFRDMKTSKSELFSSIDVDCVIEIPVFCQLIILGQARGSSGWWDYKGSCSGCGQPIWGFTPKVAEGLTAAITGEIGPPRKVDPRSWRGDSIFWLNDPGPPLVVEEVVELFGSLDVKGVVFHPAEWVEK